MDRRPVLGARLPMVGAGLVTGALAAVLGLIDFLTIGRAREHTAGWVHAIGNGAALALALASLLLRLGDEAAVLPWGLALSAIITVIVAVTGYTGGELAYRHMIGVTGHGGEEGGDQQAHEPAGREHRHACMTATRGSDNNIAIQRMALVSQLLNRRQVPARQARRRRTSCGDCCSL